MGLSKLTKLTSLYTKSIGKSSILHTKPKNIEKIDFTSLKLNSSRIGDSVQFSKTIKSLKTKFFTKEEILNMKSADFKKIMAARADIPKEVTRNILFIK